MAAVKFNTQEIDWFNDKILNVLQHPSCRDIYHQYLKRYSPANYNAFKLWKTANDTKEYKEDLFFDLIEDVDEFNENPLLTIAETDHKILFIKQECCRILEKTRSNFINYLRRHYM